MNSRQLFVIVVTFISFQTVQAQKFNIGAKAGVNINKITGKSFSDEFTFGYHAGAFAEIGLGKKFTLQPEVLFNQVTADTASKFSEVYHLSGSNLSNIKLSYLSVPVLLGYNISKQISIVAGPQFSILMDQNKNMLENGKDAFKKGDLSLLAGVKVKLGGFRIYGRYAIGLNNLNDIDNQNEWKSQSIQLGVGLSLF